MSCVLSRDITCAAFYYPLQRYWNLKKLTCNNLYNFFLNKYIYITKIKLNIRIFPKKKEKINFSGSKKNKIFILHNISIIPRVDQKRSWFLPSEKNLSKYSSRYPFISKTSLNFTVETVYSLAPLDKKRWKKFEQTFV